MTAEDYLTAFDQWLTGRIEEAHAFGKDLAFRDRAINSALKLDDDGLAWDYRLLEPGQSTPPGDGWSVYRLQGVWPDHVDETPSPAQAQTSARSRTPFIAALSEAVFGRPPAGSIG